MTRAFLLSFLILLVLSGCTHRTAPRIQDTYPIQYYFSYEDAEYIPKILLSEFLRTNDLSHYLKQDPFLRIGKMAPTGSMRPFINDHDYILIGNVGQFNDETRSKEVPISIGDIVVLSIKVEYICHRVFAIPPQGHESNILRTKGDNNDDIDPAVNLHTIKHKVLLVLENDIDPNLSIGIDHNRNKLVYVK